MNAFSHSKNKCTTPDTSQSDVRQGTRTIERRGTDRRVASNAVGETSFPLPLFSCDAVGMITAFNEAAVELWGRLPEAKQPGQWSGALDLLNDQSQVRPRSGFAAARAVTDNIDSVKARETFARPDGSVRHVLVYAKPARDSEGNICEVTCVMVEQADSNDIEQSANPSRDDKDGFITMLSHELRNPLSPILNAAVLMKRVSPDHQVSKLADVVERQAKRLARFVQDLLHASNLTRGGTVLLRATASFSEVMQCALDTLWVAANSRGQKVSVDLASDAMLNCVAVRLSQAVANVMMNASEFTGDGGHIAIWSVIEGSWVRIEVEDNGIGIDERRLDEIFKPFTHFTTHADRLRSGARVGLALAKDICEKHGGSIAASSPGVGLGSRFTISLPIVVSGLPSPA